MSEQQDPSARHAMEWDCQHAVTRMYRGVDERKYEDCAAQFAPDGVWHRQGKALAGRAAIIAALNARTLTQVTRHVLSNFVVSANQEGQAQVDCYLHTYVHDSGQQETRPIVIDSPTRLLLVSAGMVNWQGQWRIAQLKTRPEFAFRTD